MQAEFKLLDTDEMEAEMTITMTIAKWKKLREVIEHKWPGWEFSNLIGKLVAHATKIYEHTVRDQ